MTAVKNPLLTRVAEKAFARSPILMITVWMTSNPSIIE